MSEDSLERRADWQPGHRLVFLEKLTEATERRVTNLEEFNRSIVERLDSHMQRDAESQVVLTNGLAAVTQQISKTVGSIERLGATMESNSSKLTELAIVALEASSIAKKHQTAFATTLVIGGWIGGLITVTATLIMALEKSGVINVFTFI